MRLKRFLAFAVAFAMVMTMVPAMSLTAFAATTVSDEASLNAVLTTGGDIVLGDDIVVNTMIEVPSGVTATLDLAGYAITSGYQTDSTTKHIYPIDNYGTLTIKDSVGTGSITGRGIYVQTGSKLTFESGSIYGIDSNGGSAIFQYGGDTVINGGLIEQQAEGTYNFAINAGGGTVTVNGGKVAGNHGAIAAVGAAVVINDGELVCTGTDGMTDNVVYSSGSGTLTINGGTFTADDDNASGGCCVYDANGSATINGGTFGNSSGGDVWGTTGGTVINGGTFENLTETAHVAVGAVITNGGKAYVKTADGLSSADLVITTADEFKAFAAEVNNANTFSGKVVVLAKDIDLAGSEENLWTPIGTNADALYFAGTFDGQGHTISNLYVKQGAAYHAAGLFGAIRGTVKNFTIDTAYVESISSGSATDNGTAVVAGSSYCGSDHRIENVHVKNATVKGNRYVAGIVGYMDGTVTNCSVENVTIVATPDNLTGSYDNGDKVGGIVGYCNSQSVEITNCELKGNVDITAYRDAAGIVGCTNSAVKVNNNTNNAQLTITIDTTLCGERDSYNVGEFVGRNTPAEFTGNVATDAASYEYSIVVAPTVYEVATKAELDAAVAAAADGDVIRLTADIDYTGTATLVIDKAITLDLGGYTLTTYGTYGGMQLKNNCTLKNGTLNHKGTVTAIKAWTVAAIEDVVIDVAFKAEGKTIGGIVIQENAVGIDKIMNVTIKGEGLTNGIETYNCGNTADNVIGSMENVTIEAKCTGMLISAPCGSATNCNITGGVSGIELWIKGTYNASLDLVNSTVEGGTQAVYVHDEFSSNPDIVNNGTLSLTVDDATELVNENGAVLTLINAHESSFVIDETVLETVVAKIGNTNYTTLAGALAAAVEGDVVELLSSTFNEGTIKMPAELNNVTLKGAEGKTSILKDMTIMAHDGTSLAYDGITFDGIVFDNSRISITGWRTGDVDVKNFTVTNCEFKNLNDTTNSAPVHINMDADEAVENFTFTNNVIDGATGGSKSGIYAQCTGEVLVENNIINNVSFRPFVVQITTDDGIADNFVVTGNIFSGSAAGRAQGLGNNDEGTDYVNVVVTENIFIGITDAQQICYWNFNEATTTATLEKNYYDIDIEANPSKIYYNKAAESVGELIDMGVYPIYTELNADGTINKESLYTPPYGANSPAYTKEVDGYVRVWGEGGGNASESFVLKLYSNETLIATTTLNNVGGIIDGDVYVTWNFFYPESNDEYWTTTWEEGHPNSAAQPTKVELWVDGELVDTDPAKMSGADDLNPVVWAELGGVNYIVTGLTGSGTETDPYLINNLEELIWFRDKVDEQASDGSTQFAGQYFKLTADIDLEGINWNPIGSMSGDHGSFKGVFDGDGHTISNLNVQQAGNGLGLFARTAGNAEIKNLTLNNVTVKSTDNSNYVGAVVGNSYASTKITNVHVTGSIDISGRGYIGGISGHGYVVMDNVSVIGEGTISSTFWCAGGILGYGGEGTTNITNAHVEGTGETGLTITSAAGGLGAIVGMAEDNNGTQPIAGSNLSAKNVSIETYVGAYGTGYANYALGYLYGGNPTSILTGELNVEDVAITTSTGEEAEINDAVASIGDAIYFDLQSAFEAAVEGDTVKLLRDVEGDVSVNKAITLEGSGKTITGKLSVTADGATVKNANVDNGSNTAGYISAKDVLIENCTVTGGNGFRYCYTSGTVTFKDSTITGSTYGIHFDGSAGGNIVIDNCTITGWTSFAGTIESVTMKDTEFAEGNYNYIRFYQSATIENCTFNEKMAIDVANGLSSDITVAVTGDGAELLDTYDAYQYTITDNGTKLVVEASVTIGEETEYYFTLEEALAVAPDGATVTIVAEGTYTFPGGTQDITLEAAEGVEVTIDMKDKTPNLGGANVTFNNLTFEYANIDYRGMQHSGTITYNNCDFTGKMFLYGDKVVFNECTFTQNVVDYNVWTYAADEVVFSDCTFNCVGKCVLVYNEGDGPSDITVEGCTFNASEPCSTKAAIEISSQYITGYHTVNIDSATTATGFAVDTRSGNSLWNDKYADAVSYVYVDGEKVWPVIQEGTITYGYTSQSAIWGEGSSNSKESFVVELYYGEEKIATSSLNNIDGIIDGDVYVTWSIPFAGSTDEYWTVEWAEGYPDKEAQPTKVVLVADGTVVAENVVKMNAPDDLNKVVWEELEIFKNYVAKIGDVKYTDLQSAFDAAEDDTTIVLLADNAENITVAYTETAINLETGDFSYNGTVTLDAGAWIVTDEAINVVSSVEELPVVQGVNDAGTKFGYAARMLGVKMVQGAQVRIGRGVDGNGQIVNSGSESQAGSGLRFITTVDYNDTLVSAAVAFSDNTEYTNYTVGVAIKAEGSTTVQYVPAYYWQVEGEIFTTALTNIKVGNYIRKFEAQGYVLIDDIRYMDDDSVERSIYEVASGLLRTGEADGEAGNDGNSDYNPQEEVLIDVLNAYVNQTGIRLVLVEDEYEHYSLKAHDGTTGSTKGGSYETEAHFEVSETTYNVEENSYTVTLTAKNNAKIYAHDINGQPFWYEYVRINNNNSVVRTKVTVTEVEEDKVYTLTFYADGLVERPENTTNDNNDEPGEDSFSE